MKLIYLSPKIPNYLSNRAKQFAYMQSVEKYIQNLIKTIISNIYVKIFYAIRIF